MTETKSESKLLVSEVAKFLKNELEPISDKANEEGTFPEKVFRKFFAAGFGTAFFPEKWGGTGDILTYLDIVTEMGRVDLGFALSAMANAVLFGNNVLLHGNDDQRKKYLPGIVDGTKIGCWALTEPSGGSDAVGIKTTAEKHGDHYILNGSKTFITNSTVADYFIVLARLKGTENPDPRKAIEGGCAFILERGMAGLTTGTALKKMGHRTSPTGEVFLDHCKVPATALLGKEGKAFFDMKKSLDFERATFAGLGVGLVDEILQIMIRYAATRKVFGQPILEYQMIQDKIATIGAEFEVMKAYCQQVRQKISAGQSITKDGAIMKLLFSKLAVRAADEAIQTLGGYGYMTEYRVERFYRDAKLYEIGGGTSEIQKLIIAKEIAKEYLTRQS